MPRPIIAVLLLSACQRPIEAPPAVASPAPPTAAPEATPEPAPEPEPDGPSQGPPDRVVAIGDLHADLPDALAVLAMSGLVDESGSWSGGQTILVQTGDTTDRGPDSLEVIELLMRLEGEATAAGGQVHALLGNHEVMNMVGDLRYVSPGDLADFESSEARARAFSDQGELGRWLRSKDAVVQVGDTVYAHGGVSPTFAKVGVNGLSEAVRRAIDAEPAHPVLRDTGPLWFRDYLLADETIACKMLAESLDTLGAKRMIVGHTTQRSGRIGVRCGGAILGIDTGISSHYGDNLAAVELRAGDAWALYPEGPVDIEDP